jgi:hypothetical protein
LERVTILKRTVRIQKHKEYEKYLLSQLYDVLTKSLFNDINSATKSRASKIKIIHKNKLKNKFNVLLSKSNNQWLLLNKKVRNNVKTLRYSIGENCKNDKNIIDISEWLINMSNKILSNEEIEVLRLGPNFQISPKFADREKIIASIECAFFNSNEDKINIECIRNEISNCLKNSKKLESNLTKNQIKALIKLKNDTNIYVTYADKGNKTIIMNKKDYIEKIIKCLIDETTYAQIKRQN